MVIKFIDTKIFNVSYNNLHEPHTCGVIKTDKSGRTIGHYSGNIFDGYRCIMKIDSRRAYIEGATFSHLRRRVWHYIDTGQA